ncbi:MAG: hypothetical protein ACOY45_03510 [Pseudomonadota bacterium]
MHMFTKICASLICLVAFQTAASAQTLTPPNTIVTASGQLTEDLAGAMTTVCDVTLTGITDSTGITFTSMTGTAVSGPLGCEWGDFNGHEGIVLPLRVEVTSSTGMTIRDMAYSSRLGACGPQDVSVPWDTMTSVAGPFVATLPGSNGLLALFGVACHVSGSLTISPAIAIH